MYRKIIALLLMQIYVVAVFGVTLGEKICCTEPKIEEMSCHDNLAHDNSEKTPPSSFLVDHIDCPICVDQPSAPEENCCTDCETLFVAIDNESKLEQSFTNNVAKVNQQSLQAALILLPWVDAYAAILTRSIVEQVPETDSFSAPTDIPLFIRNCNYRI